MIHSEQQPSKPIIGLDTNTLPPSSTEPEAELENGMIGINTDSTNIGNKNVMGISPNIVSTLKTHTNVNSANNNQKINNHKRNTSNNQSYENTPLPVVHITSATGHHKCRPKPKGMHFHPPTNN